MAGLTETVWGPIFFGMVFNIMLFGTMVTQTHTYFTKYKKDKFTLKLFIAVLFVADCLNTAFDVALVYKPIVHMAGDQHALLFADWLSSTDPIVTSIIAALVQTFFGWRVKVLTGNWFLFIAIGACSFCQLCGGIGVAIAITFIPAFTDFLKFKAAVIIWLAFSAAADVLIAVSLVWYLRQHKTGFSGSDDAIDRIIRLTVQTGLITAVCATVDLVVFLADDTTVHLAFNLLLAKLYTNTLLSSLNTRKGWGYSHGMDGAYSSNNPPLQVNPRYGNNVNVLSQQMQTKTIQSSHQVFVDVDTIEMRDLDQKPSSSDALPYQQSFVNNYSIA
ncbi:hypothetical protein BDY19DRAFT_131256 [Irpex rosettiformis]|uniref:Uncharacterized protein n=1 Tax=Irpex rosettiformis TaxID=378272 RepID=A0ACB8U4A5_9APHY|nr:hypothetical protein BDY19DRAFT_131256 [Irpex rosettiformis]